MGYHMEQAAWAVWSDLPDRPFRVLMFIAHSLPDPEPGEPCPDWFGNPDRLAPAIGALDQIDGKQRRTVLNKISRAMVALVDAGALTVVRRASPGNRARYGVQLSMERSRYVRERPIDARRSNFHGGCVHTFTQQPGREETSKSNPLGVALGSDALGAVMGFPAIVEPAEVAHARKFRAIPGGRTDDDVGPTQLTLPAVMSVPALPPEPVAQHDTHREAL